MGSVGERSEMPSDCRCERGVGGDRRHPDDPAEPRNTGRILPPVCAIHGRRHAPCQPQGSGRSPGAPRAKPVAPRLPCDGVCEAAAVALILLGVDVPMVVPETRQDSVSRANALTTSSSATFGSSFGSHNSRLFAPTQAEKQSQPTYCRAAAVTIAPFVTARRPAPASVPPRRPAAASPHRHVDASRRPRFAAHRLWWRSAHRWPV
jgi:hypothetical protein